MKNIYLKTLLLGALVGTMAQSSFATTVFQSTLTSAGGAPVNATAAITISGTTMTVVLTDLQANPSGVASILNGIQVVVSGASGASGLTANNATIASIDGSGNYTPQSGFSGATIASSYALSSASSTITLTALGGGQPKYLIIGPDANGNFTQGSGDAGYTAAGGSIAGNGPHNPFILGTETFQFLLSGKASFSEDDITGLTFLFGTSSDYGGTTRTNITSIPEPSTVVAGALLLLPLGVQAVRGLRNRKQ